MPTIWSRDAPRLRGDLAALGVTFSGAATMQLAMIGLGRMGGNMVRRLLQGGHELIVYDRSADAVKAHVAKGVQGRRTSPTSPGNWRRAGSSG